MRAGAPGRRQLDSLRCTVCTLVERTDAIYGQFQLLLRGADAVVLEVKGLRRRRTLAVMATTDG